MRLSIIAVAVMASSALAQGVGMAPSPSVYDPNKTLTMDQRYVLTREGRDAQAWEAQNPRPVPTPVVQTQPAPQRPGAPRWFVQLPEDTEMDMYAAATASSVDEQMAYDKARMQAERKLVESMGSKIRSLTKSYRNDQGSSMIEKFEQTIQKSADGTLMGVRRVDSQTQFDGRVYKVYVLLRYPLGESNIIRRERESERLQREAELRSARAHQELDRRAQTERDQQARDAEAQRRDIGPEPEAAKSTPQSQVAPVTVPTAQGELKLMDVDNEEYKRRRDETLQKSGAVIGQSVVR